MRRVHVHLDDAAASVLPSRPFACGVTLDELRLTKPAEPDAAAAAAQRAGGARLLHKLALVRGAAAYWDSRAPPPADEGCGDEGEGLLAALVGDDGPAPDEHQYVLRPTHARKSGCTK